MADMQTLRLSNGMELPYISEAAYAQTMREVVEPALEKLRTEAEVPVKGGTLHAENYVVPGARQAVLVLHGYTESAEKLREVVWYFIQAGFSVFSYDHRGHGRSLRELDDPTIAHVECFDDYVDDLEVMLEKVVRPAIGDLPLSLYAHSMGGAVGAQTLLRHPDLFRRAVLTSPMICPSAGSIPVWAGYAMAKTMCFTGRGRERAFIAGPYDPAKEPFETSCSTSRARFDYYIAKRQQTPHLQVCAMTYRWVCESVAQSRNLLKKSLAGKVKTPVLLCQAGLDDTVRLPEQEQFVSLLPQGRLVRFDTARHEIYNSTDDVMQPYMRTVLDFLIGA